MKITNRNQLSRLIKKEAKINEGFLGDLLDKFISLYNNSKKSGESSGIRFPAVIEYLKASSSAKTEKEIEAAHSIIKKNKKYINNIIKEFEFILSERVIRRIINESTYDYGKLPLIRTANYKSEILDLARSDRRLTKIRKAVSKLPNIIRSIQDFMNWYNENNFLLYNQSPGDILIDIAVSDENLSSRSIDRIELIQRKMRQR